MRRLIILAGLALSAMPLLPQAAEARPPRERGWEDRRDWDRREA